MAGSGQSAFRNKSRGADVNERLEWDAGPGLVALDSSARSGSLDSLRPSDALVLRKSSTSFTKLDIIY